MSPDFRQGYWAALDKVLSLLNGMTTEESISQDQMRRRIYGVVMGIRPDENKT